MYDTYKEVSSVFLAKYGGRPMEINAGKLPQADQDGSARATNRFTEVQCREVVDPTIKSFFARKMQKKTASPPSMLTFLRA